MKLKALTLITISIFVLFAACKKKADDNPDPGVTTEVPKIVSLTSDKDEIVFGGEDVAIITCDASGGSIEYTWEVDLGDIFPLNEDGSQVRFTGSECCLGEKFIKCTAQNDKGSVTDTIVINILLP